MQSDSIPKHALSPMPGILYGTAWKKERTAHLVTQALQLGFRGIDTACQPKHYDEVAVGMGIAAWLSAGAQRSELYVQTKFTSLQGQDPARVPYDPRAPLADQIAQSVHASLRNLQSSYLDALVLHAPLPTLASTVDAWGAFETFVANGVVKRLGISNCYELEFLEALCDAVRVQPAVVQNRFYAQTGYDVDLRAFCREREIVYQSFWTLKANPHLLASDTISSIARKHARTPPQILFRYLSHEGVTPLTGTTSPDHMREDLAIFEFSLTHGEREALTALIQRAAKEAR
jgi:diketogulonate reductase-like aldo/keto reductase